MVAVTEQEIALAKELQEQRTDLVGLLIKKEQALTEVKAEYDGVVDRLELIEALIQEVDDYRLTWVRLALNGELDDQPLPDADDAWDTEEETEEPYPTGHLTIEDVQSIISDEDIHNIIRPVV